MSLVHLVQRYLPGDLEAKDSKMAKLDCQYVQMPNKPRFSEKVPDKIGTAILSCMRATSPWPLLIATSVGVGKTSAGLLLCDITGGRYHTVQSLHKRRIAAASGRLVANNYYTDSRLNEAEVLREIENCYVLVLDELGANPKPTEPERQTVQLALDLREGKPLLLLSNREPKELDEIYDDRIASRATAGTVLVFEGDDQREQTRVVVQ